MSSFYLEEELKFIGFKSYGKNVLISKKVSIYGAQNISIGDNVRIDDFCILSGQITIGSNIHIAAYTAIYGALGVFIGDYSGISSRVCIYSAIDDFSGKYLVGPNQKDGTTNVTGGKVVIEEFAAIGTNSTIFPNLTIHRGAVVGAHSVVMKDLKEWSVNVGYPTRHVGERQKEMINLI